MMPPAGLDGGAANFVFVTSQAYSPTFGGAAGADVLCQQHAQAANLCGTYRAWLASPDGGPAQQRFGNATGWVGTDGRPFLNTQAELLANRNLYPLLHDETGARIPVQIMIWTGVGDDGGVAAETCSNWSSTDAGAGRGINLVIDAWRSGEHSSTGCLAVWPLACFGIDRHASVGVTRPSPSRLAFVSDQVFYPGAGITAADAICQREAPGPGSFKALLPTAAASAGSRFSATGGPWVRPDGVSIFPTAAALLDAGQFDFATAPIRQLADGGELEPTNVYCGSESIRAVGDVSTTCASWTSDAGDSYNGSNRATNEWWFGGFSSQQPCSYPAHLYCLQE